MKSWFSRLSGSGKSTLANEIQKRVSRGVTAPMVLDRDNIRHGLNRDLVFLPRDRNENIK